MHSFEYDLRDDGVVYHLRAGTKVRVTGRSPRSVSVTIQKGNALVPPETGNLNSSKFRAALVERAGQRLGDINGLAKDLDLIAVALEDHLRERKETAEEDAEETNDPALRGTPYRIVRGGFVRLKNTSAGEVPQQLTNFTARVEEQIVCDDGAQAKRYYRVAGQTEQKSLPSADVPAATFPAMNWVSDDWGLSARMTAGTLVKDYTREAIELLSREARERRVFEHTGWRVLPGSTRVYLHGRGAIGAEGVEVELEGPLARYAIAPEVDGNEVPSALRRSFGLLDVAPRRVTVPLLAAIYLAPLSEIVTPDFVLWVWGGTGSLKSTLCALNLCHFGDFTETTLPLSFESTANALERHLFLLKDVPAVVDDWRPAISRADASEMDKKAQRLLRSVGNRQGRGRMNPDTTLRHVYPPRGVVIATAESLPEGPAFESATARAMSLNLRREDVDLLKLSEMQHHRAELSDAMGAYVEWMSGRYGDIRAELAEMRGDYREEFRKLIPGSHPKTPDAAAALAVSIMMLRDFAVDVGFMGDSEGDEFAKDAVADIAEAAKAHAEVTSGGDSATRFVELLGTLFDAGRAYAKDRETGKVPQAYDELGWDDHENFEGDRVTEPRRGAEFVGWADETFLYLDKDAAYGAVAGFAQRGGIPFGIKPRALWQSLARSGASVTEQGRTDSVAKIEGKPKRVVQIARAKMTDGEDG